MCLYINPDQQALIAKKDIVCYKIVEYETLNPQKTFQSFYQGKTVVLGRTYKSKINITQRNTIIEALHSFTELRFAINFFNEKTHFPYGCAILKCIIPLGSTYYVGKFYASNDGCASNMLTYIEVIANFPKNCNF
jgi:hypothetical protein